VGSKTLNKRAIDYSQKLSRLGFESYDELVDNIDNYINEHNLNYQYAAIIHDRDINVETGTLAEPHVHVQFYSPSRLGKSYLKEMTKDDDWTRFQYKDNKVQAFKYLIHDTTNSKSKAQYSVHEVRSNFDFEEFIKQNSSESQNVNNVLQGIINGSITYTDLTTDDDLSLLYAKHRNKFDNALSIAIERKANSLDRNSVSTIWIHSKFSGIGKTLLAREKANEFIGDRNLSIYQSSSSNDLFQDYKGQEVVILDDLRPTDIELTDLLRLLDPNYTGSAKSRYNNKRVTADLIIITSMHSPVKFFSRLVSDFTSEPVDQLLRRISYVCELDKVNDKKFLSQAYVYKVEKVKNPMDIVIELDDVPKVYGNTETVRTHFSLNYKKKR
jgi:hypothetical protein